MRDYHVVLSVTYGGNILDHKPLVQYWRIRAEIGSQEIEQVTLTMPSQEHDGTLNPSAPIEMNLQTFLNAHGFSNANIRRWLAFKHWTRTGTLLLFKVTFKNKTLNYTLLGKVDTAL